MARPLCVGLVVGSSLQFPHLYPVYVELERRGHQPYFANNAYLTPAQHNKWGLLQINEDYFTAKNVHYCEGLVEGTDAVVLADTGDAVRFPSHSYPIFNIHHGFANKGAHYFQPGHEKIDVELCAGRRAYEMFETGHRIITGEPKLDRLWNGYKSPLEPYDTLIAPTFNDFSFIWYLRNHWHELDLGKVIVKPHMVLWSKYPEVLRELQEIGLTVLPPEEIDIIPYLMSAKRVLCDPSSVLFEAALAGKETYVYANEQYRNNDYAEWELQDDVAVRWSTSPELQQLLSHPYPTPPHQTLDSIHQFRDGKSAERVVNEIERLWEHTTTSHN